MSQIHGKGAVIYLGAGGATAIPLGEQLDWSLDFGMATVDVTPLNNLWKLFVKGLMDYTGAFSGNFDLTSAQLWLASTSAVPEKFYLYPNGATSMVNYYYGTAWVQLGKIAAGSTTAKANNSFKLVGQGALSFQ